MVLCYKVTYEKKKSKNMPFYIICCTKSRKTSDS